MIHGCENLEKKIRELQQMLAEMLRAVVSYTFRDCTFKFTSPYRLACSSTVGGKT